LPWAAELSGAGRARRPSAPEGNGSAIPWAEAINNRSSLPPPGDMSDVRRHEVEGRLARIEGHIHAVHRMAHEGRAYPEIVHQITAIRSALDAALQAIVEDLLEECRASATSRARVAPLVEELRAVVASAL
jgi:CsoR family transcriptional regulator, copper-sensing transcriptional repressor